MRALIAVALVLAIPAVARAHEAPVVVGDWEVAAVGQIRVEAVGFESYRGRVLERDPAADCLKQGRRIWRITEETDDSTWQGQVEYFGSGCKSVGFSPATWDFYTGPNSGQLCARDPRGGGPDCALFTRTGRTPADLAAYQISPDLLRCLRDKGFFKSADYLCSQLYYARRPGRLQTKIYSGEAVVAKAALKFTAEGFGGVDVNPTRKGRRRLKRLARKQDRIPLKVKSVFDPASGKNVVREKRVTIS